MLIKSSAMPSPKSGRSDSIPSSFGSSGGVSGCSGMLEVCEKMFRLKFSISLSNVVVVFVVVGVIVSVV